ncbi:unnamed protein product [Trichogramma brassicae]|uniref:Uncharacterized protein n=1 Tax=Trichogramma brassicae TaxID=86971 RepID=A0A6H5J201_9HYME|nr:unnamed protein product [Trichogramma brassicae]
MSWPCAHPCHTDGNICCDLDLGIGLPGAPAPSNAFAASWTGRVTTAVWVPAKAFRRDLTASGPNLAASRWVRRASQISSFDVTSSRSLISIAVTGERVVAAPSSPMTSFSLWPSSPGSTHVLVSCSSISPLVLRRTLLTLPTESCSDGSDRRSFRISEYDFGSFAFTTTTSWRGRLCAFTLGFGSGALAFGVAFFFLPFFFFFLWTCCQSSSAGLEAFAASFCPLVIVLGAGVGGLLPLPPEARGTRDFPFTRGPGDVCTSFSSVFWRGRCSSPSARCVAALDDKKRFRKSFLYWLMDVIPRHREIHHLDDFIIEPLKVFRKAQTALRTSRIPPLTGISDPTTDGAPESGAVGVADPAAEGVPSPTTSIASSCAFKRSTVSSVCELVLGFFS